MDYPLLQWKRSPGWSRALATNITDLLNPDSDTAIAYPHLSEVFWDRFEDGMDKRDQDPISKCEHIFDAHGVAVRADSNLFQTTNNRHHTHEISSPGWRMNNMCESLENRVELCAALGSGSYGSVFLAREVDHEDNSKTKYYAIKIEPHFSMENRRRAHYYPSMTAIDEEDGHYHFITVEALLLLLTSSCDRFPSLDSVYVEDKLLMTVMGACVDHDVLLLEPPIGTGVPAFRGRYLWDKKKPILNEIQGCKVASHLLEGFAYLWDMNITHSDLSENNFIIDENLNTRLIDLGMTTFGFERTDFHTSYWSLVGSIERMITPELALELFKPHWKQEELRPGTDQIDVFLPHDTAIDDAWRLAATIYQIMHGFAAWESPVFNSSEVTPGYDFMRNENGSYETMVYDRRDRIINEELPIDESLSQDCADALRVMMQKKPLDRPSFPEMYSFPWFNQWVSYQDTVFLRPYSRSFHIARVNRGLQAQGYPNYWARTP